MADWLAAWRDLFPGRASAETIRHDLQMVAPFARRYGRRRVAEVSGIDAQRWALRHPSHVKWLRHAFDKAVLMGLAERNVWRLVDLPARETPEREPPTQEQLDAILERCAALSGPSARDAWWLDFSDAICVAAYCGARLGGISRLKRADVDLPAGRVLLREKGSKERRAALLGRSRDACARAVSRPLAHGGLLFVSPSGRPLTRQSVAERWATVRGEFPHGFHSLRHFAATWMLERGASELDVAIQLGHTDRLGRPYPELLRRVYAHPDGEAALARLEAIA